MFHFRWVDEDLEAHEEFFGLYEVECTKSEELLKLVKDVLIRYQLEMSKMRGQCFDGAASMSGCKAGLAKRIRDEEPRALYTHCYGHSLNLGCNDCMNRVLLLRNCLGTANEIIKLVKNSPKRNAIFNNIRAQLEESLPGIRVLCPTRWTVRAKSLESILANYEILLQTWEEAKRDTSDSEVRARMLGVEKSMETFETYFGLSLAHLLLSHSDNLSRALQKSSISAAEGQSMAKLTVETLNSLKTDEMFDGLWSKTLKCSENFVEEPVLKRPRKIPKKLEKPDPKIYSSPKEYYQEIYLDSLNKLTSYIEERFSQEGYETYKNLENLIISAAKGEPFEAEFHFVTNFYGTDFDPKVLATQLETFSNAIKNKFPDDYQSFRLKDVINYMKELSNGEKSLFSEVCTLLQLIIVMPATNAISERSFSALKNVKTYLRTTMHQERLNNLMVLFVHQSETEKVNLIEIGNEFVSGNEQRLGQLGKFTVADLS